MSFERDLKLLWQNARYLPYLGLSNEGDLDVGLPRDLGRRSRTEIARAVDVLKLLSIGDSLNSSKHLEDVYYCNNARYAEQGEKWLFINGIMTDRSIAHQNGMALNQLLKRPVFIFHNPTHGLARDLSESLFSRTFDHYSAIATSIFKHIAAYLVGGEKIRVVAHSQGGIIISEILKLLRESGYAFEPGDLEIFTIAGAQDEWPDLPNVYAEHFANDLDFVARIGVMAFEAEMEGYVHIREGARGHLLNDNYLGALAQGHYCDGTSKFHSYLHRESPIAAKREVILNHAGCHIEQAELDLALRPV